MQRRLPPWPVRLCYLAAASVLVAGFVLDRSTCVWRAVTGLPCPGCGMTHALLAIARGNLRDAWQFNRGSVAVAPILVWTGIRKMRELVE